MTTLGGQQRPVSGMRVGISVSESADLERHGMTAASVNRLTVRLSRALLAEGAVLAFGHDWRNDGIMDAVCGSAIDSFGTPGVDVEAPLILNIIPWPDSPHIAGDTLLRLEGILAINRGELPREVAELKSRSVLDDPGLRRYLRSRGLTNLRRQLTAQCDSRVCIGGREQGYSGRYPGVFEEVLFSLQADQPIYLAGLLGGITERFGQALLSGGSMPVDFGTTAFSPIDSGPSLAELYAAWEKMLSGKRSADSWIDPAAAWEAACRLGVERLAHNGLTRDENLRLLATSVEEEAVLLVIKGLRRVWQQREPGGTAM